MIKMVNASTGTEMWVADDRVDEYKAAGHSLAVIVEAEPPKEEKPKPTRKRK